MQGKKRMGFPPQLGCMCVFAGGGGVPTHKRITEHLESQHIVGLKLCLSDALGQYNWERSFRTWE